MHREERSAAGPSGARDSGLTVIELLVAMGIFTMVASVFMAGMVLMTNNTVRTEVTADAGDSARVVFQRFDKQIRYADAINLPGPGATAGRMYVEIRTPATVAASGVTTCTQWRWVSATGLLQSRTWADGAASAPTFTSFASDVVANPLVPTYPFTVTAASPTHPRQSLRLDLVLVPAVEDAKVSMSSEFVARNSSVDSKGNPDVVNGVSVDPACVLAGSRP